MGAILLFIAICATLVLGYPVALTLAGTSLLAAVIGMLFGHFDLVLLNALPSRIYGILTNATLISVPLFIFMGMMLERSKLAENLLTDMGILFRKIPAGTVLATLAVGTLLAASTGIVGATVVSLGLMSLPAMLKQSYSPRLATGTICAVGTLGQIIPPSIALILLGDVLGNAYQQAQFSIGVFSGRTISIGDLFIGALMPGLLLVALYALYIVTYTLWINKPQQITAIDTTQSNDRAILLRLIPPLGLITLVLMSILTGVATPTEAAGVGAAGSILLAIAYKQFNLAILRSVVNETFKTNAMIFLILIGASIFSLVFRGYGGDDIVRSFFEHLPAGTFGAVTLVMLVIFLLGFILDFIEITYVVVPIVAPILIAMGVDPLWLGIMIAVNLQTSFITPPFGFSLFYLRSVAPSNIKTTDIYRGVVPFIMIQLTVLALLALFPAIATWLPHVLGS